MNRILFSLGTLVVVGAVVAGGTIAFFQDTETSEGNIFVAGSIDLRVDHLRQTYNGVDCETCSVNVWSSESTQVTGGTGAYAGGYPTNAVALSFVHSAWLNSVSGSPAQWVWVTDPVLAADTTNGAEYTFEKKFNWNGSISGIVLDLALAADNGYKIVFNNDTLVDSLGTEFNYGSLVDTSSVESAMIPLVQNGENTLEITVRNKPGSSNPASNPAGIIFDLTIERPSQECEEDSAFQQACQLWEEQDLDGSQTFFNFGDIKPGDRGTNVVSLHVYDNDAWACLIAHDGQDSENTVYEPELPDDDANGELQNYLEFFAWRDDGDGDYQSGSEAPLTSLGGVSIGGLGNIANLDSGTGEYLSGTTTAYVGLAWCAGDIDASSGTIECDGAGMKNDAQSDSYTASLTAYAEQQRNNTGFSCANVVLDGGSDLNVNYSSDTGYVGSLGSYSGSDWNIGDSFSISTEYGDNLTLALTESGSDYVFTLETPFEVGGGADPNDSAAILFDTDNDGTADFQYEYVGVSGDEKYKDVQGGSWTDASAPAGYSFSVDVDRDTFTVTVPASEFSSTFRVLGHVTDNTSPVDGTHVGMAVPASSDPFDVTGDASYTSSANYQEVTP